MPLGFKDAGSLAAEIKMSRMVQDGSFLVVEGKSDKKFWWPRCHDNCEVVDGEGKENVVGCIERLDGENFRGALGVTDDDYDSLMGVSLSSRNLVVTETHDLECLLIRSPALEKVLGEFGVPEKIEKFVTTSGVDVRTALLERALIFGRLRWAGFNFKLDINYDAIRVARFVSDRTWEVDHERLIHATVLPGSSTTEGSLKRCIESLPRADPWNVVQGHDMVEILRIGLKQTLGAIPNTTGPQQISQVLRSAFSDQHLEATLLARGIRNWEDVNSQYQILKYGVMSS